VIGQAAEFDYAGTQACKAMSEEGVRSILVNSNPATIMTDEGVADEVYIEPLTVPVLRRIIEKERPEGLLPTLGGQVGLNLAVDLHEAGVLEEFNVRLLGTPLDAIRRAEDRELFRTAMREIGEPTPPSAVVHSLAEARDALEEIGLPVAEEYGMRIGVHPADLPLADGPTLLHSIQNQLLSLPDNYVVYPGHGEATTIGAERETNPFVGRTAAFSFT